MARRGHTDDHRQRIVLGTHTVTGKPVPTPERATVLSGAGVPTPKVYELGEGSSEGFRGAMEALREGNPYHASVYVYEAEEYAQMRLFCADDGKAGFALKGDEIVSVFVSRDSEHAGCARTLLATAVSEGGRRLDCFDTTLPRIYASEGFVPVARIPWNDDYKPDAWDYSTYRKFNDGRPDVVLMAYDPRSLGGKYDRAAGAPVGDYGDGEALVSRFLENPPDPRV
jgi:hypothetical protein